MAASFGWKVCQTDVKSTFLNGGLEEEVFMYQPQGFQVIKALYGLEHGPRTWYTKFDKYLTQFRFRRFHLIKSLC